MGHNPELEAGHSPEIQAQDIERFLISDIAPNQRQQDKLLAVLRSGHYPLLGQEKIELAPDVRSQIMQEMFSDDIDDDDAGRVISRIGARIGDSRNRAGAEALFHTIDHDRQILGIIAQLLKNDFNARSEVGAEDLSELLEQYPNPGKLVDSIVPLLQEIEFSNGPEKLLEYEQSLDRLLKQVYGKRYEYYQQYLLLKEQGRSQFAKHPERPQPETPVEFSIDELDSKEAKELMNRVEIHGDAFNGKRLTRETLVAEGLSPRYRVQIGRSVVWFSSSPYELGGKRVAVVAYVQSGEKVVARSYYRSNSAGVWRYLPQYEAIGGNIHWFSKGYGEESLSLPFELQRVLAEITQADSPILQVSDPDLMLAGTARNIAENTTYEAEVSTVPIRLPGNFYTGDPVKKIAPELLDFSTKEAAPDFDKLVSTWKQFSDLYGEVTVEIFPSADGRFNYMFCLDDKGRAWIAAVESTGPVSSTGLKENWVDAGSLTTPAYEYYSQDDGYGSNHLTNGRYIDMSRKYLNNSPVIQEYLRVRHPELLADESGVARMLAQASTFNELFDVLEHQDQVLQALTGKGAGQLRKLIQSVRQGALKTSFLTRKLGLRQKVIDLMNRE